MITHKVRHRITKALCISLAIMECWTASIRPAHAFAPVAVIGTPQIVAAGSMFPLAGLAALIGVVGLYLLLSDSNGNQVAIPLGENDRNKVPDPLADSTSQPASGETKYYGVGGYIYSTAQDACVASQGGQANVTCSCTGSQCNVYVNGSFGSSYTVPSITGEVTCPGGYVLSGGSCVLQNPRKATDDKRCDLLLQNGQFATADDLNCGTDTDGTKAAPLIRDGKAIVIGQNSSGQPLILTVAPPSTVNNRDWVEVTIQEQVQTATETQVKTTTATINPQTSTITGVQTSTKPGAITMPSGSTIPTTSTDTATSPQVKTDGDKVTVNTCGYPGQPPCAVDDTGFASQSRPWETPPDGPDLNDIKDKITNVEAPNIGFDWLPSIFPGQSVQCHPMAIEATVTAGPAAGLSASAPLDLCPYFDYVRMFLGFLFGVTAVIYIWKTFTGARNDVGEALNG